MKEVTDRLEEALRAEGYTDFVYSVVKYEEDGAHFSTKISVNGDYRIDHMVSRAVFWSMSPHTSNSHAIPDRVLHVLAWLEKHEYRWTLHAKTPDRRDSLMVSDINEVEEHEVSAPHVRMDLARELCVKWNNATHTGQLVRVDPKMSIEEWRAQAEQLGLGQ